MPEFIRDFLPGEEAPDVPERHGVGAGAAGLGRKRRASALGKVDAVELH